MPRPLRLLRSPWFWILFAVAQATHPGQPLSFTLWTHFGTQVDTVDMQTIRGRRTLSGDLEVHGEVSRQVQWFGQREERVSRDRLVARADVETIQHRFRMHEPLGTQWELREAETPEGDLPVVVSGVHSAPEYEAMTYGVPGSGHSGTGWTSGWRSEGEWYVGYRMVLPFEQSGDRPWALAARVLLTPFALLADLLALPAILARLCFVVFTMAGVGGH